MNTRIITVSREVGSGGRTIAGRSPSVSAFPATTGSSSQRSPERAAWPNRSSRRTANTPNPPHAFLFNWSLGTGLESGVLPISDQLYLIQHNIIQELAEKESCVIVGRCADWILRERADCLNTFFHAEMQFRMDRLLRAYGEKPENPEKFLHDRDAKRKTYYRHYTGRQWGVAQNYHLTADTSVLGIDLCVELVLEAARAAGSAGQ